MVKILECNLKYETNRNKSKEEKPCDVHLNSFIERTTKAQITKAETIE